MLQGDFEAVVGWLDYKYMLNRKEDIKMECFKEKRAEILYGRLEPGTDLFEGINEMCEQMGVKYGSIISCIGSLTKTTYTFVKRNEQSVVGIGYRDAQVLTQANELICGQGTIGLNNAGEREIHMHALMCDVDGNLIAGHLMPGCIICATMEIAIAIATEGTIVRSIDEKLKLPLFHFSK